MKSNSTTRLYPRQRSSRTNTEQDIQHSTHSAHRREYSKEIWLVLHCRNDRCVLGRAVAVAVAVAAAAAAESVYTRNAAVFTSIRFPHAPTVCNDRIRTVAYPWYVYYGMKYTFRCVLYLYIHTYKHAYIHSYIQSTLHIVPWQTNETESVYCVESVLTRSSATSFFRLKLNRAPAIENSLRAHTIIIYTYMHTYSINNVALLACLRHISADVFVQVGQLLPLRLTYTYSHAWCYFPPYNHTVHRVYRLYAISRANFHFRLAQISSPLMR